MLRAALVFLLLTGAVMARTEPKNSELQGSRPQTTAPSREEGFLATEEGRELQALSDMFMSGKYTGEQMEEAIQRYKKKWGID